ncbi:MAG: arginine--tRNA ligase [Deltaproteobacteria bacterium]|nr:arginine--tRNA ligase [Deltaproteobacteria bacterium]
MQESLVSAIAAASALEPSQVSKVLVKPDNVGHGDFAFPCFILAKEWKLAPPACAAKLKEAIALPPEFVRAEAVGPYLNFFLDRGAQTKEVITNILGSGLKVGEKPKRDETILVEYSSPNIAKHLHVGHLRTTLIGHSLALILKHLGYRVESINHLGDWGVQFGFLYAACKIWGRPDNATVDSLLELYVKASQLKKAQDDKAVSPSDGDKPDVGAMAREYFIRLEAKDPEAVEFWQWCLDISLHEFRATYERLNIYFDHYTGESFYSDHIPDVEAKIKKGGILKESRGALGVDLGKELGFARVFADDGRSLYITRDLAAAIYREKTFSPAKIVYVVAAQQTLHFRQLVAILKLMNEPVAEKIVHVAFGFVPGMRTREGTAITVHDFLEEAHERALAAYREEVTKRPEGLDEDAIAEAVAIGATYFYFLEHTNIKDFNFSWQEALNFSGDSGAYAQYALARLYSIETKAREAGLDTTPEALQNFDAALLAESEAYELVSLFSKFDATLEKAARDFEPAHIAHYVLDLSRILAKTYKTLRVVGEEQALAKARLALFMAARNVLHTALTLLGVPAIERM